MPLIGRSSPESQLCAIYHLKHLVSCAVLCLVVHLGPTLCDPMDCSPPGSSLHGDSPGKNAGVGYQALLQWIFPTQGLNLGCPHCRLILYQLSHQGSPLKALQRDLFNFCKGESAKPGKWVTLWFSSSLFYTEFLCLKSQWHFCNPLPPLYYHLHLSLKRSEWIPCPNDMSNACMLSSRLSML